MAATVDSLRAAGILAPLDAHFARAMGRLAGEERPDVLLAAAMASRHVGKGHVCVDLPRLVQAPLLRDDDGAVVTEDAWPALDAWLAALRTSPLIGEGPAVTPLVLDGSGRLYLRRYWEHQERLATAIRARAAQLDPVDDGRWMNEAIDRLFLRSAPPALGKPEPDWQRIAALVATQRRFCVVSGGPGTGKTFTVVKILALLVEQALRVGERLPRVTLVAPTGKAAARLSESIRRAKGGLPCTETVKHAIPEDAATIHRCLGSIGGSATHFRYHAGNPLVTDVVLVDEASMVDLALMTRLITAIPPRARVILLGDKDQLASVEAGAVLGDICNTGMPRSYSAAMVERIAALTGDSLPLGVDAPPDTGIWDCIVQLTHSYRYSRGSGIEALARAINAGDSEAALTILDAAQFPDVTRVEPQESGGISASLRAAAIRGFGHYLRAAEPIQRLRELERFRILCAHRRGPDGLETVNQEIETALEEAGLIRADGAAYSGRPIMVTRNDYQLNLFNGDVGVVLADPGRDGAQQVFFAAPDGRLRVLSPARLPPHETVFAMSIHKSQGSEFDEVAVLLPRSTSPVLTRELLYTAVTRARRAVSIHASGDMIAQAIAQRIERASGLRERLWG